MLISKCCGSIPWNDADICAECKQDAKFVIDKEFEKVQDKHIKKVNGIIMGKFKEILIGEMDVNQAKELLDDHSTNNDRGYILFLEEQLTKVESKIHNIRKLQTLKLIEGPGYCVECFKTLPSPEIICGKCQDECDGRWDHLRE